MEPGTPSFYPPRAPRYAGLRKPWYNLRRTLGVEKIVPWYHSSRDLVLSLLIPCYGFWATGRQVYGLSGLLGYLVALLIFVMWLGYAAANLAFGIMVSLHATATLFLVWRWIKEEELAAKLGVAALVLVTTWLFVYLPVFRWLLPHYIVPLHYNGKVVVIRVGHDPASVKRGDWIAFRFEGYSGQGFRLVGGLGLERVQALPGERVRFSQTAVEIAGVAQPQRDYLPKEGEWVVREKSWIVWQDRLLTSSNNRWDGLDWVLRDLSNVPMEYYVGRPFQRWFWRKQMPL